MRWLGLDLGTKTIGVATCDEDETIAGPHSVIARHGGKRDLQAVIDLVASEEIQGVVLGLPLDLNGTEGESAKRSRAFAKSLADNLSIPVELWDERFSTTAVEHVLLEADMSRKKRKKVVDKVAAAYILQGFIDHRRFQQPHIE